MKDFLHDIQQRCSSRILAKNYVNAVKMLLLFRCEVGREKDYTDRQALLSRPK